MVQGGAAMNHRKKAVLIVISALVVIGLFAGGFYLKAIGDYKAKVNALTFDEIDLTNPPEILSF